MGRVLIQDVTVTNPITLIGREAGVCWGANTTDAWKNYQRGLKCIKSGHGRTLEFPDVYMILEDYSARVIREFYTHIGGAPTRLQASTRYIDYEHGFDYIIPPSVENNEAAKVIYDKTMNDIKTGLLYLEKVGVPREDSALLLPLGMTTRVVAKANARTLTDMSRQRMCSRAYWEYRELFSSIKRELSNYSDEWKIYCDLCFMPKCEFYGWCPEEKGCGKFPKKGE